MDKIMKEIILEMKFLPTGEIELLLDLQTLRQLGVYIIYYPAENEYAAIPIKTIITPYMQLLISPNIQLAPHLIDKLSSSLGCTLTTMEQNNMTSSRKCH